MTQPLSVSVPEARRHLGGCSTATIYRMMDRGILEKRKIGGRTVILMESIQALLDLQHRAAAGALVLGREGRSDHKREGRSHYAVGSGKRLPEMPSLVGVGIDGDSSETLDCKRFGEGLIRDIRDFHLRQLRRSEGAYCPAIEQAARKLARRLNIAMPRARLLAELFGDAE